MEYAIHYAATTNGVHQRRPGDREAILAGIATEGFGMLAQKLSHSLNKCVSSQKRALGTAARTYVDFALLHPGYFRVMFRSDVVPIENYPEALHSADAAFGALVRTIDRRFAGKPPEVRRNLAFTCWAFMHGLATLLLNGPLTRRAGNSKGRQEELAGKVISAFKRQLGKNNM